MAGGKCSEQLPITWGLIEIDDQRPGFLKEIAILSLVCHDMHGPTSDLIKLHHFILKLSQTLHALKSIRMPGIKHQGPVKARQSTPKLLNPKSQTLNP